MLKVAIVGILSLGCSFVAAADSPFNLDELESDTHANAAVQIGANSEWAAGDWDDPTQGEKRHRIGELKKTPTPSYKWLYSYKHTNTTGQVWPASNYASGGSYLGLYLAPLAKSQLKSRIFVFEGLGLQGIGGGLGYGNRAGDRGMGLHRKPGASATDPFNRNCTQSIPTSYSPNRLDERSKIQILWEQQIVMTSQLVHDVSDGPTDQTSYGFLRCYVIDINGNSKHVEVTHDNGSVRMVTSTIKATASIDSDGVAVAIGFDESVAHEEYEVLTSTASFNSSTTYVNSAGGQVVQHSTKKIMYSKANPVPQPMTTVVGFDIAMHIDDSNEYEQFHEMGEIRADSTIQTCVRAKEVKLIKGTQGRGSVGNFPRVSEYPRNFGNDADLMEAAFGDLYDNWRTNTGTPDK